MGNGMRYYILIVAQSMAVLGMSQNSQFNASTNNFWSEPTNWSAGIPTSTTNVTTSIGANIEVDVTGECNDISLFLSSLTVLAGGQLTIHGQYSATTVNSNVNDGTLIIKGSLKPAIGTTVITLGNGGSVTFECGATFSNFSIDRN